MYCSWNVDIDYCYYYYYCSKACLVVHFAVSAVAVVLVVVVVANFAGILEEAKELVPTIDGHFLDAAMLRVSKRGAVFVVSE
jgi:hypothetical protein